MELTPEKIYRNYNNKTLDKISAVENLISIVENSDNINTRLESIRILRDIGAQTNKVFKFLENLLLSDFHEKIRQLAAETLKNLFIEKALEPIKWALQHEDSPYCLNTIYYTLIIFFAILTFCMYLIYSINKIRLLISIHLINVKNKFEKKDVKCSIEWK